ncbi:hypothetical protein I6N95_11530 [Vagococcus sp. BWB3-3]|uniref:Uncharacterized protein n=1 Tax=Vagococcus allomyrinae TaxID=2794353 RepID=A0A940SWR7_9ENTE|nr:hypothetical protein [Vagococcus allomyrinae]MBP1041638.1 hypothetical protein [Vagococcus allomyrinae]
MTWTAEMFEPIVDAAKAFVPIGIGVGVAYFVVVGGAKKGFAFIRGMFKG